MIDNVNKVISFLFKGRFGSRKPTFKQKEVRQQDDYQLSKDEL
jgi:hypothetical protein